MPGVEVLLGRLDGVQPRGARRWVARCPAHKDRRPSLSIMVTDDGRILLNDFAGCSVESVLEALALEFRDLYPEALGHHHERVRLAGSHAHAAADALKVIAHECTVVQIAAEDLAAGMDLSPRDRARLLEAAVRIRGAARVV